MVDFTKGMFIACDVVIAQFIISLNAAQPPSEKFIIHVLDDEHLVVQPDAAATIRSAISEFRHKNSYGRKLA